MLKNDAFVMKIAKTRLKKICIAIFALAERLPTSATLAIQFVLLSAWSDQPRWVIPTEYIVADDKVVVEILILFLFVVVGVVWVVNTQWV